MIEPVIAVDRLINAMKQLQRLMQRRIDPEGTMTAEAFEDSALAIIDAETTNEAMETLAITEFLDEDGGDDTDPDDWVSLN